MDIRIKLFEGGKAPVYATEGAACADCFARLAKERIRIPPDAQVLVNLGFALELPEGWEAVIRPRSGLSKDLRCEIGTIDCDYRGELKARLHNISGGSYDIANGERVCQLKVQEARRFNFVPVETLSETERGEGGFGSTGSFDVPARRANCRPFRTVEECEGACLGDYVKVNGVRMKFVIARLSDGGEVMVTFKGDNEELRELSAKNAMHVVTLPGGKPFGVEE